QTKKPANQTTAGTRITPKDQIDAANRANQETARLERDNADLRKRQAEATGTTTTAGTATNAGTTGGGSGQPSETQKMLDQIRAERLKQQYTSLWTSPIAATWEP